MNDLEYMKLAINLAKKGRGRVNPNPLVGAVIVKDNEIIGQGYHEKFGEAHAEINALKNCKTSPKGATIYVTLEPCCHFGKTPPCVNAIIENGIRRVVIGTLDKNPLVAGKSVEILKQHNIAVTVGVLENECNRLIKVFSKFITTKKPYVLMKYAMTIDGKIATHTGKSKWISSEASRNLVHKIRNEYMAIMVGVNTIIHDNPMLTSRISNARNPIRIICDTNLRTPLESNVIQSSKEIKTILATSSTDKEKITLYENFGCVILNINKKNNHLDLTDLMTKLGEKNIDSILLEGGSELNWSALDEKIVDEVHSYIAPKIFGGKAKTPIAGAGISSPNDAIMLTPYSFEKIGEDFLIKSEVSY